jgi:DNA primase
MPYSGNIIDQVRENNDIVEVISSYIPLKKTGRNYQALCPFHTDTKPSFSVSPEKQIFYCFGCNAGGNVFQFVMKYENISFGEALRKLAKRVNIKLPENYTHEHSKHEVLYRANEAAAEFYHKLLISDSRAEGARKYLRQRGLTDEMIDRFQLGWAPASGRELLNALINHGFEVGILKEAGLVTFSQKKQANYDLFWNRIMFPISSANERIIGFGGRVLSDGTPKYLNSGDTPLFRKGKVLYALANAKKDISSSGSVIMTEGYFDTITCHQFGFTNCCAGLGTALTEGHVRELKRYAVEVILLYDGDFAGIRAAVRSLDIIVQYGLKVKVAVLPQGYDPDSYLHKNGKEKLGEIITNASSLLDFRLKLARDSYDLGSIDGKVKAAAEILPTITRMPNAIAQHESLKWLAEELEVPESVLREELKHNQQRTSPITMTLTDRVKAAVSPNGILKAQKELLGIMLNYPENIQRVKEYLNENDFESSPFDRIAHALFSCEEGKKINVATLIQNLDETKSALVCSLSFDNFNETELEEYTRGLVSRLLRYRASRRRRDLGREIARQLDNSEAPAPEVINEYKRLVELDKGSTEV